MEKFIYLNNASTSYPKPEEVLKSVTKIIENIPFHQARQGFDSDTFDIITKCRNEIKNLFNATRGEEIVFTSGSTESLNLVINGIEHFGKHFITTSIEHNSVLRPLKTLERGGKINLSIVKCDKNGYVNFKNIEDVIKPNTVAIIINHCSNVTSAVNDLSSIGKIAKERGIKFIVDASQSAGVYSIDVQEMNIDFLAFTGHKSLYGIQGIGGAYIKDGFEIKPLKIGGTGVRSDYLYQPETIPMLYEAGTQNLPGIASLYEGVKFIRTIGIDNIRLRKEELVSLMRKHFLLSNKITVCTEKHSTIFSFNIDGVDSEDVGYILEKSFGIIVRAGLHCAPLIHEHIGTFPLGCIRVSPSYFTTEEEIIKINKAIDNILLMEN